MNLHISFIIPVLSQNIIKRELKYINSVFSLYVQKACSVPQFTEINSKLRKRRKIKKITEKRKPKENI